MRASLSYMFFVGLSVVTWLKGMWKWDQCCSFINFGKKIRVWQKCTCTNCRMAGSGAEELFLPMPIVSSAASIFPNNMQQIVNSIVTLTSCPADLNHPDNDLMCLAHVVIRNQSCCIMLVACSCLTAMIICKSMARQGMIRVTTCCPQFQPPSHHTVNTWIVRKDFSSCRKTH